MLPQLSRVERVENRRLLAMKRMNLLSVLRAAATRWTTGQSTLTSSRRRRRSWNENQTTTTAIIRRCATTSTSDISADDSMKRAAHTSHKVNSNSQIHSLRYGSHLQHRVFHSIQDREQPMNHSIAHRHHKHRTVNSRDHRRNLLQPNSC